MNIKKRLKIRVAPKSGPTKSELEKIISEFTEKWMDHVNKHYPRPLSKLSNAAK
jgi:hypothetical protein